MSDIGGAEVFAPGEGPAGVAEALSEQAKQRFAAAAAAGQQLKKQEGRSRRRDQGVAQTIIAYLTDAQRAHLATLIARLVERDCPSAFLLAILSLSNPHCRAAAEEYLHESLQSGTDTRANEIRAMIPLVSGTLSSEGKQTLLDWVTRTELALALEPETIIKSLLVGGRELDASLLQLTTFVLEEFLRDQGKIAPIEKLQHVSSGILHSVFSAQMEGMSVLSDQKLKTED